MSHSAVQGRLRGLTPRRSPTDNGQMTDMPPAQGRALTTPRRGLAYRRRIAGTMCIACGAFAELTLVVPGRSGDPTLLLCGAAAIVLGLVLVLRPLLMPRWTSQVLIAFITVMLSVAISTGSDGDSALADAEVLYVLTAIYCFYFFSARAALGQAAFAAATYGVVLWGDVSAISGVARVGTVLVALVVAGLTVRAVNREVERLVEELGATAAHAPLTGAFNRRGLGERLDIELVRSRRNGEPITVIAVDLDGLKQLNDAHGHPAGDEAIALVATTMTAGLREMDVVARTGGDEFLLLLPNCDAGAGIERAQALCAAVRDTAERDSRPITISMGGVTTPPVAPDPDVLAAAADQALYRAKAQGRNQVAWGESEARIPAPAGSPG